MKKPLFPQANSLNKIVGTLKFLIDNPNSKVDEVAKELNVTPRQGGYYVSALYYFGFINDDNVVDSSIIELENSGLMFKNEISHRILLDPIISDVYFRKLLGLEEDITGYAESLLREFFHGYSDSVYKRRATSIIAWIKKIGDDNKWNIILYKDNNKMILAKGFYKGYKDKTNSDKEVLVYKGSKMIKTNKLYKKQCIEKREEIMNYVKEENDYYILTKDINFSSPSLSAAVLLGQESNGNLLWKDSKGNKLKDILNESL